MSISEKLSLGASTAITGMGIVFMVLLALWLIIVLEHKFFEATGIGAKKSSRAMPATEPAAAVTEPLRLEKTGRADGKAEMEGVDDETAAVIMAAVSEEANLPMSEIRIKSIRKL